MSVFYLDHLWFVKAMTYAGQWLLANVFLPAVFLLLVVVLAILASRHDQRRRGRDSQAR